eukprot:TRINITY_DN13985_c0_g1_i1.p1 TRINITY_DN13985_c0_g1~~TRINITY_DN13985_c0_g1_i1.p1  ORF type:complete len:520 (-),score=54.51 TRINITY_DN13985_c0_g1_i1:159-1718(-)
MADSASDSNAPGGSEESIPRPADLLPLPEDVVGDALQYIGISMFARIQLACKAFASGYFWNYMTHVILTYPRPRSILVVLERNHRRVRSLVLQLNQSQEMIDFAQILLPHITSLSLLGDSDEGRLEKFLSQVNRSTLESFSMDFYYDSPEGDGEVIRKWIAQGLPRLKELRLTLRNKVSPSTFFDTNQRILVSILKSAAKSVHSLERLEIRHDGAPSKSEKVISEFCLANSATLKFVDVQDSKFFVECLGLSRLRSAPKSWKQYDDLCQEKFCVGLSAFRCNSNSLWTYIRPQWSPDVLTELFELCMPRLIDQADAILVELLNTEEITEQSRLNLVATARVILAKALPELQHYHTAPFLKLAKRLFDMDNGDDHAIAFIRSSIQRNFESSRRVALEVQIVQALLDDEEWCKSDAAITAMKYCVDDYGTWLEISRSPTVLLNVIHFLGPRFFECRRAEAYVKQLRYESYYPSSGVKLDRHLLYLAYLQAHVSADLPAWSERSLEDSLEEARAWSSRVGYK